MSVHTAPELGATLLDGGRCRFVVWAPQADTVEVHIVAPQERMIPLGRSDDGYFEGVAADVGPGARYSYRLDGNRDRPDPASRFQPDGVHGPTQVTDPAFAWEDAAWRGLPLREQVFYELHVGTFTPEGTFDAVIPRLAALKALGVTTIELMPVAQFPGERNWGYDGVHLYAVQNSYGGPAGLKRLVNAAHREGLAVALDVVYNHLGPEGAYLGDFGPYFTDRYKTPWGGAVNFDGPQCDEVRRYFLGNALMWITECHIDALRLDALHAIIDMSAQPFLKQLTAAVHAAGERAGRQVQVIAEIDRNDPSFIRPPDLGGYGMDALWNDDFHHALRTLLTGDRDGYYRDFGTLDHLVKAINEGFVYTGQRSAFRERSYGASSREIPAERFVVFTQNHDQIGNRMRGDRLSQTQPPASLKLAAAIMLLSPYVPMLFMGEEYGETSPFLYFVSHGDADLIEAVRKGRREEFAAFAWQGEAPDPQDPSTFEQSKLHWELPKAGPHKVLREWYAELLRLRRDLPALADLSKEGAQATAFERERVIALRRQSDGSAIVACFNLGDAAATIEAPLPEGRWRKLLDSTDLRWLGDGGAAPEVIQAAGSVSLTLEPQQCVVYERAA